jgi:hypothetical protein
MFGDVNIVLRDDTEDRRAIACAVSNLRADHEIIANGWLIAAAPEMLAALESAPIPGRGEEMMSFRDRQDKWLREVRNPAVEKAQPW